MKKYLTLIALGLAGGVMYVYPYIRYVFHNPLMEALHINDTQAGLLITAYGVVSLFLYIPGGILTDKLRAKKPLLLSLGWAFVLLVFFALILSLNLGNQVPYFVALAVWILMPFASTFVFWNSLVKAIEMAGSKEEQGRCFGIYFAANAVFGTIISSTNMFAYTQMGFTGVTLSVAFFFLIAIIAIAIFFKEKNLTQKNDSVFVLSDIKLVLKNKTVWLAAICMMLVYMMFTCTTYFTPFMTAICGLSNEASGILTIFRTYFIMIFAALFSGIIADKVFHSTLRWFKFASICLVISTVIFLIVGFNTEIPVTVVAIISIIPGIFSTMIYAIQFSLLSELNLPTKVAGTASGLASMFVFSPDIYFNTALGAILDNTSPDIGYFCIFCIMIAICILIVILCKILINLRK